jgi:hypothetical protein
MTDTADLAAAWDVRVTHMAGKLPHWLGSAVLWLRDPSHRLVRILMATFFLAGSILSVLPLLGIWMLPLGLSLLAEDIPSMKPPLERASRWLIVRWQSISEYVRRRRAR